MKGLEYLLKGLTVAVLSVAMCSCGGSDDENDDGGNNNNNNNNNNTSSLVGTWSLTSMSAEGQTVSAQDAGISWTITFNNGGTMSMTMNSGAGPESFTGTWTTSGNMLTMTVEGDPLTVPYTLSGNTFSFVLEGLTLNFTRN